MRGVAILLMGVGFSRERSRVSDLREFLTGMFSRLGL